MADLCTETYDFDTMEAAYRAAFLFNGELTYRIEEWLINLQNHLMWGSYEDGVDPMADIMVTLLRKGRG